MSRKDTLRALLSQRESRTGDRVPEAELSIGNSPIEGASVESDIAPKPLVRSGAVGAMGRSLGKIASAAEDARALIGTGTAVVELDTKLIENSFIADRLSDAPQDHSALVASIREHGQQVPILVRPHPARPGYYQVAYGHRRLRALIALGRPVRAVVRELSDAELIVAQGQENSARLDLSYIETAFFAVAIEDRGFDRQVLMAALGIEKTQLSRLITIGRGIPLAVIQAIGPASKAGRPRWTALVEVLAKVEWQPILDRLISDPRFRDADSDARLAFFEAALSGRAKKLTAENWLSPQGTAAATIKRGEGKVTLVLDQKVAPDFGEFIIRSLPDLYQRYAADTLRSAKKR